MPKIQVSRSGELNEIFLKCVDSSSAVEYSLNENSIQFLMLEEISESDIAKVNTAIEAAGKQIESVEDYLDKFGNLDRAKIGLIDVYIGSLKDALDKARSELSAASFETGAVSSFLGQKLTLPQITQASIALHTKAADFGSSFSSSINKIKAAVEPYAKEADLDTPVRKLAGTGAIPDEAKMKKGIEKALFDGLGGGFFKKVVGFFTSGPTMGAEKKVLDSLPKLDNKAAAAQMADALLDTTLNDLTKTAAPPKTEEPGALQDVATQAQETEEEQAEQTQETGDTEDTGGAPPPESEEEAQAEQDAASDELTSAVQDAGGDSAPPGVAVMAAIDTWYNSLSASSQQTLKAAGRYDGLKSTVQTTMDGLADTVEDAIRSAMADWRSNHEETLIKSKRFAKKNFDTLEQTVPQLAAFMIKKVEESSGKLTKSKIRKTVFNFLNKRFTPGLTGVLNESYTSGDMAVYRLHKLAGLDK